MPKLILSMDGLVLKEIALDRERISIGRKPNNDVQIDNLAISGQHAVITTILDDAFLEDQNSTNGTYVNGQPVKKHVLRNNDVVELGKYRLKFIADPPKKAAASVQADFEPPPRAQAGAKREAAAVVGQRAGDGQGERSGANGFPPSGAVADTSPPGAPPPPAGSAGPGSASAVDPRVGVVRILNGPNAGRELPLTKSQTTLGKPGQQVAAITRRLHGYYVARVEGDSFPLLNGNPVDAQALRLGAHDVLEIAGVRMEFLLRA